MSYSLLAGLFFKMKGKKEIDLKYIPREVPCPIKLVSIL